MRPRRRRRLCEHGPRRARASLPLAGRNPPGARLRRPSRRQGRERRRRRRPYGRRRRVRRDARGRRLRRRAGPLSLEEAGVRLDYALRAETTPTGVALITVSDEGENTIVVAPGANALLAPEDVEAALLALQPAVTLVSLEIPPEAV